MFWLHFSARFGRTGAHVVPPSALASPLHGSWAPLVVVVTPFCAAGPDRWQRGQGAHTATNGVNVRVKGPRPPPIEQTLPHLGPRPPPIEQSRTPIGLPRSHERDPKRRGNPRSAPHRHSGAQEVRRYAKRPLSPVGASPCCHALVRRRSSSGPAHGRGESPRGRCPRGRQR